MGTDVPGEQPHHDRPPQDAGAGAQARPGRDAWHSAYAEMSANLARTIALMKTVARTEEHVAQTLQATATPGDSETAARRLRLSDEAIQGAHAAAERSEHLQQVARRLAEHADVAALRQSLAHAATVLADLASTVEDIANTLTRLAGRDGSDLAAQRRRLAGEALAGARGFRDGVRALHRLAETSAAKARPQ